MSRANWRPVLDSHVNGSGSQAYGDWWGRCWIKVGSISAPSGDTGLDAARTHWLLLDRVWTIHQGNLQWLSDKLCLVEYKLMDGPFFFCIYRCDCYLLIEDKKATIWICVKSAVHSSPVQGSVFLSQLCPSCLGIHWHYKQEVAPTSHPCSAHPSQFQPSPKQTDLWDRRKGLWRTLAYTLQNPIGCRRLIPWLSYR